MAENDRTERLIIQIKHDQQTLNASVKAVATVQDRMRMLVSEAKSLSPAAASAAGALRKELESRANPAVDETRNRFERLKAEIAATKTDATGLAAALERAQRESASVTRSGRLGGQGFSSVQQLIPSGPIRQGVAVLDDFTMSVDRMGVRTALAGGALGIAAVAMQALQEESKKFKEAADARIAGGLLTIELAKTSTSEELKIKRDAALAAVEIARTQADAAKSAGEEFNRQIAALNPLEKGALLASVISGVGESGQLYKAAQEAIEGTNTALIKAEADLLAVETALKSADVAANDLRASETALAKARADALPRLTQLAEQSAKLQADNAERESDLLADRNKRDERESAAFALQKERQERTQNDRLLGIGLQGAEALAKVRDQGLKRLDGIDNELGKLVGKRSDVDKKYMADSLADLKKFRDQEIKLNKRANLDLLRTTEDLKNDLQDLESANDVSAFARRERDGLIQLRRISEDASTATQERTEQFAVERQEAAIAHQEALANVDAEIQAKQAARMQIEAENKLALDSERERIKQTRDEQVKTFEQHQELQQQDRDLRLKYQAEDDQTADTRRKRALDKQIADIELKAQAEIAGLGLVSTAITGLINAATTGATSAISRILSAAGVPTYRPAMSGISTSGASLPPAYGVQSPLNTGLQLKKLIDAARGNLLSFHTGGKSTREQLAILRADERVLSPMQTREYDSLMSSYYPSPRRTAPSGAGGGANVTVNLRVDSLGVGDIASEGRARQIAVDIGNELGGEIIKVVNTALYGRGAA